MGIKGFRPLTPGRRHMTVDTKEDITREYPEKSLTTGLRKKTGRNNYGRITMRFKGGGARQLYRFIDFKRDKYGVPAVVETIEYDPNRSSRIALLNYKDGERRYIIAPVGLKVGDAVMSSDEAEIKLGNNLALKNIPVGTLIHNVELIAGSRRDNRPRRRFFCPDNGQGRGNSCFKDALGRAQAGQRGMQGHGGPGREP